MVIASTSNLANDHSFTRRTEILLVTFSAIGLVFASYLAWHGFRASNVAGCSGNQVFDCSHVLNSRWSKLVGVPVSAFAVLTYVMIMLGVGVPHWTEQKWLGNMARKLTRLACLSAGCAALWFIYLQAIVLHHFCWYCLAAHACSLVLAASVIMSRTFQHRLEQWTTLGIAVTSIAIIGTVQSQSVPPPTYAIETYSVSTTVEAEEFSPGGSDVEVFDPFAADPDEIAPPSTPTANEDENKVTPSTNPVAAVSFWSTLAKPSLLFTGVLMADGQQTSAATSSQPSSSESKASETESTPATTTPAEAAKSQDPETTQPRERRVFLFNRSTQLKTSQWPVIGNPAGKYIVVEMFDYTCPHCRATHPALKQVAKEYGDEFGILAVPVPMNSACNDTVTVNQASHHDACQLAELAIAVWLTDPGRFGEFHNWMLESPEAPSFQSAFDTAAAMVTGPTLQQKLDSGLPRRFLQSTVRLYKKSGKGTIPKIVFPNTALVGKTESPAIIRQMVQTHLASGESDAY